mgnify:CR=1 FL=1|jgi:hypothetical protein
MDTKTGLIEQGCRLSGDSKEIKELIKKIVEEYDKPDVNLEEKDETEIDKSIAQELKKKLDELTNSNWNVIIGSKFAVSAGIQQGDQYGHFKMNKINIIIMESRIGAGAPKETN